MKQNVINYIMEHKNVDENTIKLLKTCTAANSTH